MTEWLINRPVQAPMARVVLAHGAGAPMDSEFMERVAGLLCAAGCEVVRFEFPYMALRRTTAKRSPPDREPVLTQCWREQLTRLRADLPPVKKWIIGGKSMGGRMASLVADELSVNGLVCFGYPFHPAGKPERLRTAHLAGLQTPALIIQGTRDPLGNNDEVKSYQLSSRIQLHWLDDGDHDLKPRVRSGFTWEQHLYSATQALQNFIKQLP
jgi:predicted alpha/beta-hydrolase family hydrolase